IASSSFLGFFQGVFYSGPPKVKLYGIKGTVLPLVVHNFCTMELVKKGINKCYRNYELSRCLRLSVEYTIFGGKAVIEFAT
uniref:Uncharacterized protein n=1 Tax=Romanomermis culicivorax TaxID=13658 RepID=A0A915JKT8_ROMCU